MKIRSKLAIFIVLYLVIWILAMSSIFNGIAMKGYAQLEDESFNSNVDRSIIGFQDLLHQSDALLTDWAEWDDTYRYIHAPYPEYLVSNISRGFLLDQALDFVLIYGIDDKVLNQFQLIDESKLIQIDDPRLSDEIIKHKNETGIMLYDGKPLVFSTMEITSTDEKSARKGLLSFAFFLKQKHIKSIEADLGIDIKFVSSKEPYDGEEDHIKVYFHDDTRTALIKYGYVNSPRGIAMQLTHPLSILKLGQSTMIDVIKASVIAFLIISSVLYTVVRKFLFRMNDLSDKVNEIAHNQDLSLRLDVASKDEMSILTQDINFMLDRIENMNEQLTEYASFDMMTGVYNRRIGFDILGSKLRSFNTGSDQLTICYIDINNLKVVNDTLGHGYGDDLIVTVSSSIKKNIKSSEVVCRLGGDEFLVIFPSSDITYAKEIMLKIEKALVLTQVNEEKKYPISISKGFLSYDGEMDLHTFVEAADQKMYAEKRAKKDKKK